MGKRQQHVMQRKQKPDATSARKRVPQGSLSEAKAKPRDAQNEDVPFEQLETIFACLPAGIIACDQDEKILWLNTAALKLFEMPSKVRCRGAHCREFFDSCTLCDEQQRPVDLACWFRSPGSDGAGTSTSSEEIMTLQHPSGQKIPVNMSRSLMRDAQKQFRGMIFVFHELSQRSQKALHLQRVHDAVLILHEAITHFPEHFPESNAVDLSQESLLLSPPVIFIAQQLVEVIRCVLGCQRVSLKALAWPAGFFHYVAGSGFTAEQEEPERRTSDLLTLTEALGKTQVARLFAKKEVILRGDRAYVPLGFGDFATKKLLLVPLFLEEQLTGVLCIVKEGLDSVYTPEEIELVKAIATQAVLIVKCLSSVHEQVEIRTRELALQEVRRLSNDFLILASHELRTPLTGIVGNLQLAQHRLETLQHQAAARPDQVSAHLVQAQQPLASASQSARLQQRIINDIIDDARIQTNQLQLHLERCNRFALIKAAEAQQQRLEPEQTIVLGASAEAQRVSVLADAGRITQVFTTYLTNAFASSPAKQPVTVQVMVEDQVARVSVHSEGPEIPPEEQKRLWERSYRGTGSAVQHDLDLSLGFGLYLCKAFIELQGGSVGVQSTRHHGTTFWFTLSVA